MAATRLGARLRELEVRREGDGVDRIGVVCSHRHEWRRAHGRERRAILAAMGVKASLTLAPPEGNSTTLPMRMKIVVADWSAPLCPQRFPWPAPRGCARAAWMSVVWDPSGGLTMVSRAQSSIPPPDGSRHPQGERLRSRRVEGRCADRGRSQSRTTAASAATADDIVQNLPTADSPRRPVPAKSLDEIIARRERFLTSYQNAAYAARYRSLVERCLARSRSSMRLAAASSRRRSPRATSSSWP